MPRNRPTLQEMNDNAFENISTRLPGNGGDLRRQNARAFAAGQADMGQGLYAYQEWMLRQLFPETADEEFLLIHAAIRGVVRKGSAIAVGLVDFTGQTGAVILAGTLLTRGDGAEFKTLADINFAGTTATGEVQALTDGAAGNCQTGVSLNFNEPMPDVESTATVSTAGIVGGIDLEDVEELRARVVQVWREPPQGGAKHDYKRWAMEIEGVTRAWVYPKEMGPGTVTVRYLMDDEDDIFPALDHTGTVHAHIEAKRPVCPELYVVSPIPEALNLSLQIAPLSEAVKTAVRNELNDLLTRVAEPGTTVLLSQIREAVSIAAGERDNKVLAPTDDVVFTTGKMPVLGAITWGDVV